MPFPDAKYPPKKRTSGEMANLLLLCLKLDNHLSEPPHRSWIENQATKDQIVGLIVLQARRVSEEAVLS